VGCPTLRRVGFSVAADAYDRFMGRYSVPLAPSFVEFAGVGTGQRVLDVGCGPGALTTELVERLGSSAVVAVDPSDSFVRAVHQRLPRVWVARADAERLPLATGAVDAALAQLVVHFMADPVLGLGEMGRVTQPGGVVAACVWDFAEGGGPLSLFWEAARDVDPHAPGEAYRPGTRRGDLVRLLAQAGLRDVEETALSVGVGHDSFSEWWEPFTFGVGPAGMYVSSLDSERRERLGERCRGLLPPAPFEVTAVAWAARGVAPEY